jgi:hypothetical protein
MIIIFCEKKFLLGDIDNSLVLYWGWGACSPKNGGPRA